ncbi:single-stranded-DNA-specific exonuclease RecJ [Candidatus Daviesbacteria bacterium RIFCSPHIGHO2_12_FULL_37_11]|uniref:Single-stranded-DNA-specific exonuclease RecJ n=1 Tax=Candidatus Daviesbacteria bacterium RIFCSPHIGHO2_12_FULL_37_11 TaxID=1797777 RepID=A0A1F5K9J1_9BACT|nr:MAG: single-stranded-DNA-specific exonuclease RecJ [Candidatus Daviesbacteria bacterium RIFCSPHIGHO2_01_FULL_37_27]OGE37587.1 MAG: single-stranded-DNA-specific exonuclease RecJ [Candidatus Daviesbacteria bacterium RIFCSPHIGHO2_12_FULL_37_11]OGE46024.1 MAG: single-stranded-DNA-specific exonuclease RecJ [Candidatus Daviesbacteria bacterium RIFCSPLOWO2_01_FULL_37_10]
MGLLYTYPSDVTIAAMEWKILPRKSDDLIEQLLINRAVETEKQKKQFFDAKLEDFEKELNIKGIPGAKKRIKKSIKEGELIIAYGDFDADGICGAAVLYLGLTSLGAKVLPYIPHREKEGYGLSKAGLKFARDSGAGLVISVDCGIMNFEEALIAKQLGLELIITDHHQPLNNKFPEAAQIVHSTKMCGTAVAWSLIKNLTSKKVSDDLLDLVAMATIADMIPLLNENRALVRVGLKNLNQTKRVGLLALFSEAGIIAGNLSSYEVGHIIAPRLNAMGRLEHAIDSLRLLCTKDPVNARKLAEHIGSTNLQRKELTIKAFEDAKLLINGSTPIKSGSKKKIHVLSSKDWISGIVGLIAGRVCEETRVPAIAISVGLVHSKGSARSVSGINIVESLRKCSDILVAVGGHPGAAGFTIETANIEIFRTRMEELMDGNEANGDYKLEIEAEVPANILTLDLAKELEKFEPFGVGNRIPILATSNMKLSDLRTVGNSLPAGRQGKHLKGKADNIDFIAFNMGSSLNILENGQYASFAYTLDVDRFQGSEKLQLKVKDIKTA